MTNIKETKVENNGSVEVAIDTEKSSTTTIATTEDDVEAETQTTSQEVKNNDEELILIQDTAFTIKIQVPNLEAFDLQVTSMELVQELHLMIMDKEETCHRTCFSLQLDGTVLDNFSELKTIEGIKDGSVIKLVEEPYTVREARLHVRHINDLIHSVDPIDNYNGVNCSSLTYLNDITNGDVCDKKNKEQQQQQQQQQQNDHLPPDYILPNVKDVPIMPLHLSGIKNKRILCLKQLTFSGWNPPPGKRKMKGDLLYLHVITLEDKRYHITASTRGFYINQ
jgi:protein TIF31